AERFRMLEPRLSKEGVFIKNLDPSIFETSPTDTSKEAKIKLDHMLLYYEYIDLSDKLQREHLFFVADEFQELISVDPAGGVIYTETNFPNISRSTNFKYIVAAQTKNAYIARVGKEDAENFLNQMRTQIFLPTEDTETIEYIEKLCPKVSQFKSNLIGKKLKVDGKETDYTVYSYFNAYISELVSRNKELLAAKQSIEGNAYPYDHDIFTTLEPIYVDLNKVTVRNAFTSAFETDEDPIYMPKLQNHFYTSNAIPAYRGYGSLASGVQDNRDNIQSSLASAVKEMEREYNDYMSKVARPDESGFSASEYGSQGSNQAFVLYKRAGTTMYDQIVLSINDK
ncbi:MAG TPA: TraM recognition domain-containing protein, partial [Anaerovoracaceae bacterium]|nr:TraM recognition domain-containing protein [Anaerovoracaceae bacterium]